VAARANTPRRQFDRLLTAPADGLTQSQACIACGIGKQTLDDWRERYPELEPQLQAARKQARQNALAKIKEAAENDWRAAEAFLRLSFFPNYNQGHNINVNATATAQTAVVVTEEQRRSLIELRERVLAQSAPKKGEQQQGCV
jgi:hypothetical protein